MIELLRYEDFDLRVLGIKLGFLGLGNFGSVIGARCLGKCEGVIDN